MAFQRSSLPDIPQAPAEVFAASRKGILCVFISCFPIIRRKFSFYPIPNHSLTFSMTEKHLLVSYGL